MTERQKVISIALGLVVIAGIFFALWLPSRTAEGILDFSIFDTNRNFHFEVGEKLEFVVTSPERVKDRHLLWQMGNGDTLRGNPSATYIYQKPGKYLVTLHADGELISSQYIQIVSGTEGAAIDSVPKIIGLSEGYQDEELTFSATGPGIDTWLWEFGESGTVDAYEQQVVYVYETPGLYTVKLQTNTTKYPIEHRIRILPRFEKVEEVVAVDSLSIAQDDIKRRLQIIANTSARDKGGYKEQVNYIRNTYFCIPANQVAVVINGEKYNDFLGYCQGLHFLESNPKRRVQITDVKIDDLHCVHTIEVTQNSTEK